MSHTNDVQKQRAKRGRRRKRRPRMRPMDAYTPRIRREKHATITKFRRRHPDTRQFSWQRGFCDDYWQDIANEIREEMQNR